MDLGLLLQILQKGGLCKYLIEMSNKNLREYDFYSIFVGTMQLNLSKTYFWRKIQTLIAMNMWIHHIMIVTKDSLKISFWKILKALCQSGQQKIFLKLQNIGYLMEQICTHIIGSLTGLRIQVLE